MSEVVYSEERCEVCGRILDCCGGCRCEADCMPVCCLRCAERCACGVCRAYVKRVSPVPDLPLHRTWANVGVSCSTCDDGGCPDCTDPS